MSITSKEQISCEQTEHPAIPMTQQARMFPVDIIEVYPNDQGSADMQFIGHGRDSKDYAIKTASDGKGYVATSELFCYELAQLVFIPVPDYSLVKLDGEIAFGSVWLGDAYNIASQDEVLQLLYDTDVEQHILDTISKIYGFDLFVNNIDRHFGNYLFTAGYKSRKILLAFDFGRAWLEIDYKGKDALIPSSNNNSLSCSKYLKRAKRIDLPLSIKTVEDLCKIEKNDISSILQNFPKDWLPKNFHTEFLDWWGSDDFLSRKAELIEEISRV